MPSKQENMSRLVCFTSFLSCCKNVVFIRPFSFGITTFENYTFFIDCSPSLPVEETNRFSDSTTVFQKLNEIQKLKFIVFFTNSKAVWQIQKPIENLRPFLNVDLKYFMPFFVNNVRLNCFQYCLQ